MNIIFNKNYEKIFISWIITLILMIALIIIVGGLTRLTDSGLSITQWELFSGIFPPYSEVEWIYYFNLYKEIPEFKLQNYSMTMKEFKIIFWWEWIHRFLGRLIGLSILIPLIFFSFKINIRRLISLYLIFLLVCFQGFIGWYMVSSGLVDRIDVSHFRLSAHLFIAFLILSCLIWYYLNLKNSANKNFLVNNSRLNSIKFFIFLIFLQIIFGAFVSGLDAGKIYQTWPLMNNSYFPDNIELLNFISFFNFDDQGLIQFFHRNIAYLILIVNLLIGLFVFKHQIKKLYKPYFFSFLIILLQIILGILTLLSNVNIGVASLHQISSIFLLILSLNLYHKSIV